MNYIYYDDDNGSGCLVMLIFLAMFAFIAVYFGYYVLLLFLALGIIVGFTFSLIIYVRSFANAVRQLKAAPPSSSKSVVKVIKGIWDLFYNVAVNSINETMTVVSNSFTKFLNHKVLSFQKWMWLAVVVCIIVCEILFVVCVFGLEALLFLAVIAIVLALLATAMIIYLAVAIVYTAILNIRDMIKNIGMHQRMDHFDFSTNATYKNLVNSFPHLINAKREYVKVTYADMISHARLMWSQSGMYNIVSIKKWFYLASFLTVCVVSHILNIVFMLLYTITYIVLFIVNALWSTGTVVFHLIRP